jgi:hypothetical protein
MHASKPFGDVAWGGRARGQDLIAIFEVHRCWPGGGKCEHFALELVGQLPSKKILKISDSHA